MCDIKGKNENLFHLAKIVVMSYRAKAANNITAMELYSQILFDTTFYNMKIKLNSFIVYHDKTK